MKMPKTSTAIVSSVAILVMVCTVTASASTIYSSRTAWNAQVTGVTTETFDALSGQFFQTLTLDNVIFDVPGSNRSDALWVSHPGNYVPIDIALVGNYPLTTVRGMFGTPVGAVGADISNLLVNDTIGIDVDINGVWYLWNVSYTYPTPFFFGIVAGTGESIDGITFSPTRGAYVGIDNFSYAGAGSSTPEPGSILLLGSGILGVAGLLRRRLML